MKHPKSRPTLLALALMPLFAFAEDEAVLDTVTVTGTKSASLNQGYSTEGTYAPLGIGMTLRETPQSVSIVTAKQMEDWKLTSLRKVMDQTNGITVKNGNGSSDRHAGVFARGMEVRNFQMDGTPFHGAGFSSDSWAGWGGVDTHSLDRVEVLRGASALLGGTGDPSAQISLVRKRPTKDFKGEIGVEAGSHKHWGVNGDVSGRLNADGSLRGRIVAGHDRNGYQIDDAKSRNSSLYAVAEWDIAPSTTVSVGTQLQNRRDNDLPYRLSIAYDTEGYPTGHAIGHRANNTSKGTFYKHSSRNVFAEVRHRFSPDWKAKFEYNWSRNKFNEYHGIAGMKIEHGTNLTDFNENWHESKSTSHSFAASVDGKYSLLGRKHDIMAGISGFNVKTRDPLQVASYENAINIHDFLNNRRLRPDTPPDSKYSFDEGARIRQTGVYFATRFRPTERLALIGGARYSHITSRNENFAENTRDTVSRSKVTPYIGAVYDFTDNLSAYTSYGTSFEPVFKRNAERQFLKPTTGRNFEVGLKGEFFEQRLNASLSLFSTRKNGVPKYIESGDYYVSEDNIRTKGVETEVSGRISDNWSLNAGYTYQKRRGGSDGYEKDVPKHQFKLASTYDINERFTLGGSLRWQSHTATVDEETLANPEIIDRALKSARQKSYTLVDLMAAYRINKNAEVSLNVNNLFNTRYRSLSEYLAYGARRNAVIGFKYRF